VSWRRIGREDRGSALQRLTLTPDVYDEPRVSPDGTRLAAVVAKSKESYIAVYDFDGRTALRRLTFGGNSRHPVWSRDSQRVTFQSDRDGDQAIFWQRADGTGVAERLTTPDKGTQHVPESWSPGMSTARR
jgi:Tol biopolymer transport system component